MLIFGPVADFITIETLLVLSSLAMGIPSLWIFFGRQFKEAVGSLTSQDYEMQTGD